ncbi:hypothetical protein [Actinacidiphila glaucinigra]|nr:hypothetical protein [Actinacidiphila glaucinigra]
MAAAIEGRGAEASLLSPEKAAADELMLPTPVYAPGDRMRSLSLAAGRA